MEESLVSAANTTEHKTSHSCILGYTRLISRIGQPVYENEKCDKLSGLKGIKGIQMVQFECPGH